MPARHVVDPYFYLSWCENFGGAAPEFAKVMDRIPEKGGKIFLGVPSLNSLNSPFSLYKTYNLSNLFRDPLLLKNGKYTPRIAVMCEIAATVSLDGKQSSSYIRLCVRGCR